MEKADDRRQMQGDSDLQDRGFYRLADGRLWDMGRGKLWGSKGVTRRLMSAKFRF